MRICYVVLLYMICFARTGAAQYVYDINDSIDQHIFVYDFIEYLEDPQGKYAFEAIKQGAYDGQFTPSSDFTPDNYNISSTYWYKITIRHHTESRKKWLLEFFDQTIDSIRAYIPVGSGQFQMLILGSKNPFGYRRFKHKNFVIPIENDTNVERTYYFRIKAAHKIDATIVLRSFDYFSYYALNEYFFFGLFYGLIILMALYNLLLFFALRESPYIYFVLYALSITFYFSSLDGFAYQYVWPKAPEWNSYAASLFKYSLFLFAVLFTQRFLHLKFKAPKVNLLLNLLIVLRSCFLLFAILFLRNRLEYSFIDLLPLFLLLGISSYFFYKGYKASRLIMLAFVFLTIGALIKVLQETEIGNIGSGVLNYYSINLGFLLHLIMLSLALGDKVRIIKNKKDRAMRRTVSQHEINQKLQTKVNRELEQKVSDRTLELNHKNSALQLANAKLEKQSQKIIEMNQLLDEDIWKLKKESKLETKNRLMTKGISFEEFSNIFPSDAACYQYLAWLKWENGFACKKCEHHKFTEDQQLARRCSRCGYVESAIAHTIFHNIHFSISKAFYIAHLEISGTVVTLKELSAILNLRAATISSFRNKVAHFEKIF